MRTLFVLLLLAAPVCSQQKDKDENIALVDKDIEVRVLDTIVGPAVVNVGFDDEFEPETSRGPYIQVLIEIRNTSSTRKVDYWGWGNYRQEVYGGPRLTDEFGNEHNCIAYPEDVTGGEFIGVLEEGAPIYPHTVIREVLVFEAPTENAKKLTLRLPQAALDQSLEGDVELTIKKKEPAKTRGSRRQHALRRR